MGSRPRHISIVGMVGYRGCAIPSIPSVHYHPQSYRFARTVGNWHITGSVVMFLYGWEPTQNVGSHLVVLSFPAWGDYPIPHG